MNPSTAPKASKALKPLKGTRILSIALNLPGPAALMRLKAMGAACTKLEGPSGDPMGHYAPAAYAQLHAGVKLLKADLKSAQGQAKLHAARHSHRFLPTEPVRFAMPGRGQARRLLRTMNAWLNWQSWRGIFLAPLN